MSRSFLYDTLSVIFAALATAIGVSFPFLPSTIPGPLTPILLAALAIFSVVLSGLSQVISIENRISNLKNTEDKSYYDTVELPRDEFEQRLSRAFEQGKSEGRAIGIQEGQERIADLVSMDTELDPTSVTEGHDEQLTQMNSTLSKLENELDSIQNRVSDLEQSSDEDSIQQIQAEIESLQKDVSELKLKEIDDTEVEKRLDNIEADMIKTYKITKGMYAKLKSEVSEFDTSSLEDLEYVQQNSEKSESKIDPDGEKETELE